MARDFKISNRVKLQVLEFYRREAFVAATYFDVYDGPQPESVLETPMGTALGRITFPAVSGTGEVDRVFDDPYVDGDGYRMDWKGSIDIPVTGDATLVAGTATFFRWEWGYVQGSLGIDGTDGVMESVHLTGADTIDLTDMTIRML